MSANIIIKSSDRKKEERFIRKQFTIRDDSETREAAEIINARTKEVLKRMC